MLNPLQSLLDYAFYLPPLLEELDARHPSDQQASYNLYTKALKLPVFFDDWETNLYRQYGGRPYFIRNISWSFTAFPVATAYLYKEAANIYTEMLLATLRLRLSTFDTHGYTSDEFMKQAWNSMQRICCFFDYFFEEDKKRFGQAVFFLMFQVGLKGLPNRADGSLCMVDGCSEQRTFCRNVCKKLEDRGYMPWDLCQDRWNRLRMECQEVTEI